MSDFNPVKQDKDGVMAKRVVWTSKSLDAAIKGLVEGRKLVANPFYENNTKLLKGDLVFKRTDEEVDEFKHCMNDVLYFAEKYCKLMTPEGIKNITLRDYQTKYLKHLEQNRLSIYKACRQCGKCVVPIGLVKIKVKDELFIDCLKKEDWDKYLIDNNIYELPIFEIMNLYKKSPLWSLKYKLYKRIYDKDADFKAYSLLSILDKQNEQEDKIVWSHILNGVEVCSKTGWVPVTYIHETKPFYIYKLTTKNGLHLDCADEHLVFDESMNTKWVVDLKIGDMIQTEYGVDEVLNIEKTNIKVSMCDISVLEEDESYYTNHILSHNTTTSAIFLLHYALFNTDKNTLVVANKRRTSVEILDKIKKIYLEVPYFLKPGILKWNEAEIVFDNGCRVMAEATTINSGISFTFHCVLADEFAHIAPNILDKFYNNIFPTITAGRARFIITSTPLDYNLFYRLFKAAEAGENDYAPFSTDWWEVPEWNPDTKSWDVRDEAWHQRQIANYGSEEAFNKQFGASFDVNANTLIKVKKIKEMREKAVEFVNKDIYGVSHPECFFWDPIYDPMEDLKKDHIIITCDLAEGGGNDYTVFIFNKLLKNGETKTVGMFRCNSLGLDITSRILQEICCKWCNFERLLVSIELNMYGDLFSKMLFTNRDTYNDISNFDETCLVKYYNKEGNKFTYGIKLNSGNKNIGCKLFKEKVEKNLISNLSTTFLMELENFSDSKGNDTYQASFGHDDVVMAQMQLVFVTQTPQFKYLLEDLESGNNMYNENVYNPYGEMLNFSSFNSYFNVNEFYQEEQISNFNRLNRF